MIERSEQEYYQCGNTDQNENPNCIQHRFDDHQEEQFQEKGAYEASPMRFGVVTICLRTEIEKAEYVSRGQDRIILVPVMVIISIINF